MKRAGIHIVLVLFALLAVGAHQPHSPSPVVGTWQFKSPMPEARSGATAMALGDFIYVIGGKNTSGDVVNRVDRYDPVEDSWETVAPLQNARFNAASVVWNNTIVVMGGRGAGDQTLNTAEQFNVETNSWSPFQALLEPREGHAAVVLNDMIYVAGGSNSLGRIFDSVESFNAQENTWTMSGEWTLDFPRASFAMAAVNDSAYAIGGFNTFGPLGFVQRFHPVEGTANREGLAPARGGLAAAFKGDRIFALGGLPQVTRLLVLPMCFFLLKIDGFQMPQ